MLHSSPKGLTSLDSHSNAAAADLIDAGNQKVGAVKSVVPEVLGSSADDVGQGLSARSTSMSRKKTGNPPMPALMINENTVNQTPVAPAQRPFGLPLRFIDQQELRHASRSDLRKVVRSHARRDGDVKRRHIRDSLKARSPRQLLLKSPGNDHLILASVRNQVADPAPSQNLVTRPRVSSALQDDTHAPHSLNLPSCLTQDRPNHPSLRSFQDLANSRSSTKSALSNTKQIESQGSKDYNSPEVDRRVDNAFRRGFTTTHDHHLSLNGFRNSQTLGISPVTPSLQTKQADSQEKTLREVANIFNSLVAGSWRHDPFDIHGDLSSPRVSFLLSHYHSILDTVWVSSKHLVSFQTSRRELLHATVLFAASHLRAITRSAEYDRDILHHKGETIRIINSSLDDPSQRTSDQMIGALSSLILYEESYGSREIAAIHRQGLQQILQLRYSKPDLGIHRFVQHLLAHPPEAPVNADEPITEDGITMETYSGSRKTLLGDAVTTTFLWMTTTAAQFESASYRSEGVHQARQDIENFLELWPNYPQSKLSFGFRSWLLAAIVYLHVVIVPVSEAYPLPRNEEEIIIQLKDVFYWSAGGQSELSPCSPRLWVLMLNGLYARTSDPVLLGSPEKLDLSTVSEIHWCRAQLLLRDIPWAERRYKLEVPIEDDWEWVKANGFWRDSVSKWNGQHDELIDLL